MKKVDLLVDFYGGIALNGMRESDLFSCDCVGIFKSL
jgi:hypothetical protein